MFGISMYFMCVARFALRFSFLIVVGLVPICGIAQQQGPAKLKVRKVEQKVIEVRPTEVVQFEDFAHKVSRSPEDLLIVNFWATWCVPCVEEIPHFISVYEEKSKESNLGIMFVSLDHVGNLSSVEEFSEKTRLPGTLLLLDDVKRFNEWIPKVHSSWDGTLPATGFYKRGRMVEFRAEPLSEEELEEIVDRLSAK